MEVLVVWGQRPVGGWGPRGWGLFQCHALGLAHSWEQAFQNPAGRSQMWDLWSSCSELQRLQALPGRGCGLLSGGGAGGGTGSRQQKWKWRSAGPGPAPSWRAEGGPAYQSGERVCPALPLPLPLPRPLRGFPARGLLGAAPARCSSVQSRAAGSCGARLGPDTGGTAGRQRCVACSIEHIAAPGQRGAAA